MEKKIVKLLKQIEKEKDIKIIFAVESGSRAWGMSSKDSDYDVRFVFVRPLKEYILINPRNNTLSASFNEKGEKTKTEGCLIDIQGFDIFKFINMLSSSNPTTIEWLKSKILYYGERNKRLIDFAENQFNPISLYWHYKSMCRSNYLKYLKSRNLVTYKKYLYAMRGLINAKYVALHKELPPIEFPKTIEHSFYFIDDDTIPQKILDIITLKKDGNEKDIIQNIIHIDNYIENWLKDDSEVPESRKLHTVNELNEVLQEIVLAQKQ